MPAKMSNDQTFSTAGPCKNFCQQQDHFINGKMLNKNKFDDFVVQLLKETSISLCRQQVKITGAQMFFTPKNDQK